MSWRKFLLRGFLLLLFLAACNLPTRMVSTEVPPVSPTEVPPPVAEMPPPPEVQTTEEGIVHVSIPGQGGEIFQTVPDQISRKTAPIKQANGGDAYGNGRFERPFTAEEMEYLPYIDIAQATMLLDGEAEWVYASILLAESPSLGGGRQFFYGFELDIDLDGRGDVLIIAEKPEVQEWTAEGVRVWKDVNEDVGGLEPIKPDVPAGGDGFETLLFDSGKGEDADMAWVRRSAEDKERIEFAFKLELVAEGEEKPVLLWGAWTFMDQVHPEKFDIQDHYTLEEAGSPLKENVYYPLRAFSAADNTCRGILGMTPTGQLPGMCAMAVPQAGESTDGLMLSVGVIEEICVPVDCDPWGDMGLVWDPETCSCVDE